jgi:hypothetical protein
MGILKLWNTLQQLSVGVYYTCNFIWWLAFLICIRSSQRQIWAQKQTPLSNSSYVSFHPGKFRYSNRNQVTGSLPSIFFPVYYLSLRPYASPRGERIYYYYYYYLLLLILSYDVITDKYNFSLHRNTFKKNIGNVHLITFIEHSLLQADNIYQKKTFMETRLSKSCLLK